MISKNENFVILRNWWKHDTDIVFIRTNHEPQVEPARTTIPLTRTNKQTQIKHTIHNVHTGHTTHQIGDTYTTYKGTA